MSKLPCIAVSLWAGLAVITLTGVASAQDDARARQQRLLCALLGGDLADPGGLAEFRRCLSAVPAVGSGPPDPAQAVPPAGFGGNSRQPVGDGVKRFLAAEGLLYAVSDDARLWRRSASTNDPRLIDEDVAALQIVDGHLFVQSADGTLSRAKLDGSGKTRIDAAVAAFQPVNAGLIYVLGTDGILWREIGDAGNRTEVDRTVKAFQAVDASLVFVLGADQKLWREVGTMRSRSLIASQVIGFQYIPDGDTTYVQTGDATLWRKSGNEKPEEVDTRVAAFQAIDMHLVYVLGADGRLWQEIGGRSQAALVDRDVLVTSGRAAFQATDPSHIYLLGSDHKLWAESMPAER
jgi:hypothetical protein